MIDSSKYSPERKRQYDLVKKDIGDRDLTIDLIDSILSRCKSKGDYNSKAALLRGMWYEIYGYNKTNFADIEWYFANKTDRPKRKPKIPYYITDEDLQSILLSCRSDRQRLFIMFLASTGMRSSELTDLKLEDLTNERNMVVIRYRAKKTKELCERAVDSALIQSVLDVFQGRYYLFETQNNKKYSRCYISDQIRKISYHAIGKTVSAHTLRHYWITKEFNSGKSLWDIASAVGHRNPESTFKNYIHREVVA